MHTTGDWWYIYMEYVGNNHMNYLNYIHLYMGYPQWSHGLCILAYEPLINWHAAQEGALLDQGNQILNPILKGQNSWGFRTATGHDGCWISGFSRTVDSPL